MMSAVRAQTLINAFEEWVPRSLAMEKDQARIGLQVGSLDKQVAHVMVTLDVLEPVVDEAIEKNVDLIIAHHPLIFRPLTDIDTQTSYGRTIAKCLQHDITVYAAHTNLDAAECGVNDLLAEALHLNTIDILAPVEGPVEKQQGMVGYGRIGYLNEPQSLADFAEHVKTSLDVEGLRVVGALTETVEKVALLGGAGDDFIPEALKQNADVYITGDVFYHAAHDAWMEGLNLIDPGHHVEKVMIKAVADFFKNYAAKQSNHIRVSETEVKTEPFTFL